MDDVSEESGNEAVDALESSAASERNDSVVTDGWQPVRKVRTYEHVLEQIEERIRSGQLRPGDRLPGERQLSTLLDVSRPSLREALRVLETLEIIVPRGGGKGAESGALIAHEPGEALTSLLRFQIALSRFPMQDVVETRCIVEGGAARRAASRATQTELDELARILQRMGDGSLGPAEFNELDTDFHVTVARAAQNKMVAYWMRAIRGAIRYEMAAAFDTLEDWRGTAEQLTAEHQEIYDAICAGDGERAARLVETHITNFYAQVERSEP